MIRQFLFLCGLVWMTACAKQTEMVAYAPAQANDIHNGITVTVTEVIHHPESAVVRLHVAWPRPDWVLFWPEDDPILYDGADNLYAIIQSGYTGGGSPLEMTREVLRQTQTATPNPVGNSEERVYTFAPVSTKVGALMLGTDALRFNTAVSGSFTLDLGADPQVGQRWPLDVTLDVAGFPVGVTAVSLTESEKDTMDGYQLLFDLEIVQQPDLVLDGLLLEMDAGDYMARSGRATLGSLQSSVTLPGLPTSPVTVGLDQAVFVAMGPWLIDWSVTEN